MFNELLGRVTNHHALKCFIGSLLNENSDMQQYVWLHGKGENGKGALSRFLHKVFGEAYSSQIPPLSGDKFWTSMILGKRLVVFPDCNNQGFVTSGLFKSLTGGDPVRCEQKQQPAFTRIMTAKYLFLSNERPNLSSEKADQRRIIYCEVGQITVDADPKYEAKLWLEGGAFLASCMVAYAEACPENGQIPIDKTNKNLADWVSTVEEPFETAWEHNFVLVGNRDTYVTPAAFQDRLDEIWPRDRKTQSDFRSWAERKYDVKKVTHPTAPGMPKVYFGLALVFAGRQIRLSQTKQRDQQDIWNKEGRYLDANRTAAGRLTLVAAEGLDGKDGKLST